MYTCSSAWRLNSLSVYILFLIISIGFQNGALSFFLFIQTLLNFTFTGIKWCLSPTLSRNHNQFSSYCGVLGYDTVYLDVTLRLWWEASDDWMERRALRRVERLLIDFSTTHLLLAPTLKMYGALTLLPLYASTTRTDTTLPCPSTA
jgi:hypothetical protein